MNEQQQFAEAEALLEKLRLMLEFSRAEFAAVAGIILKSRNPELLAELGQYLEGQPARLEAALGAGEVRH